MNSFADRLRYARLQRKLTQAALAKACGLSQGAIANYEGKSRHTAKEIFKIASVLKVNALWLAEGAGPMELIQLPAPFVSDYQQVKSSTINTLSVWPFKDISPDDYWSLSDENRAIIESAVTALATSLLKNTSHLD